MSNQVVRLLRQPGYDDRKGTPGYLVLPKNNLWLATLENSWFSNVRDVSSIPCGQYDCEWVSETASKHGPHYRVNEVKNRDGIIFHAGNWCRDTKGCILLGMKHQPRFKMITDSRKARGIFEGLMDKQPFTLLVTQGS